MSPRSPPVVAPVVALVGAPSPVVASGSPALELLPPSVSPPVSSSGSHASSASGRHAAGLTIDSQEKVGALLGNSSQRNSQPTIAAESLAESIVVGGLATIEGNG